MIFTIEFEHAAEFRAKVLDLAAMLAPVRPDLRSVANEPLTRSVGISNITLHNKAEVGQDSVTEQPQQTTVSTGNPAEKPVPKKRGPKPKVTAEAVAAGVDAGAIGALQEFLPAEAPPAAEAVIASTQTVVNEVFEAAPAPTPVAAAPVATAAPTREAVHAAMKRVIDKYPGEEATKGMAKAREILGVYGSKRISEVKEADFASIIQACDQFVG